jgi:ABC-type sugar transport system substrate-binding protein
MLRNSRFRPLCVVLASLVVAASLAACGGSEKSSSGGKSTTASSSESKSGGSGEAKVKEEAAKLVAQEETPPANVPEATPLKSKDIPKGKTVAFLGCGAEQCLEYYPPIKKGAEALGWTSKLYQGSVEPNKMTKYLEEIVASKPSVFIACCVAPSLASKYFKQLKEEGTISVMCCTAKAGTEALTKLVSLPEDKLASGKAAADFMLAEKGEKLNVLYVNSKDFEVSAQYAEGLKDEISRLCSKCEVHEIQVAVENIGKPAISTEVVSYLRSHPEINYVSTLFSPLLTGVPAAMKAAGIEDVGITSTASGAIALEDVKTGKEYWKAVQNFGIEWGLWGLNIAVRTMLKEPLSSETATPEVLVTEKNAAKVSPGKGNQPVIANALEQYEKLWGV